MVKKIAATWKNKSFTIDDYYEIYSDGDSEINDKQLCLSKYNNYMEYSFNNRGISRLMLAMFFYIWMLADPESILRKKADVKPSLLLQIDNSIINSDNYNKPSNLESNIILSDNIFFCETNMKDNATNNATNNIMNTIKYFTHDKNIQDVQDVQDIQDVQDDNKYIEKFNINANGDKYIIIDIE